MMSPSVHSAAFGAHMYENLMAQAAVAGEEIDGMRLIQLLAGVMTETVLLFDDPDQGYTATMDRLIRDLRCDPLRGPLGEEALPPPPLLDRETEQGRAIARRLFEDWLECAYDFHELVLFFTHNALVRLEQAGQPRAETFRLFSECLKRTMMYEIAAQELCDIVIDGMMVQENWSLSETVSGLSAVSGRCLALVHFRDAEAEGFELIDKLDEVTFVMTQEAIRLGIPAGSDWRFGLAANDHILNAPYELISVLEPQSRELFRALGMADLLDQSVACAKAAGRMLALAAGGEDPDVEPVIAKPLAMAALTDTYKTMCRDHAIMSC